jgi:uncharacterized RDD family membrane protein YckC
MVDDSGPEPDEIQEPAPAVPPAEAPPTGVGAPAEVGTRFIARIIDHILLAVVIFALIIPFVIGAMFADVSGFSGFFGGAGVGSFVSGLVTAAITIAYFAFMESNQGRTIGKMVMGLRTEAPGGGNPTMEQALRRNAWYALGIIPWLGGLAELAAVIYIAVTISNSATNTGWHDQFAGGTRVVRTK